jgi:hypothetical protein
LAQCNKLLVAVLLLLLREHMHTYVCATLQEEVDEFFDANSLLGSLQQAFSSAMASSYHSTAASACGAGGGSIAGAGADDVDIFAMHDLAASIREVRHWIAAVMGVLFFCGYATKDGEMLACRSQSAVASPAACCPTCRWAACRANSGPHLFSSPPSPSL